MKGIRAKKNKILWKKTSGDKQVVKTHMAYDTFKKVNAHKHFEISGVQYRDVISYDSISSFLVGTRYYIVFFSKNISF